MNSKSAHQTLEKLISSHQGTLTLHEYRQIAREFQILVEGAVLEIWEKHKNRLDLTLNGVPVASEGSAVNTSTAIGFLVEEFIVKQLPEWFSSGSGATGNSAFDFFYSDDSKIKLMVNLKVEKNTSNNKGVVAANILRAEYLADSRPKIYLIVKSKYHLDAATSSLRFDGLESVILESFITRPGALKSDNRNWSAEFNALSGRLQLPSESVLNQCSADTIPKPEDIREFMKDLQNHLIRTKTRN